MSKHLHQNLIKLQSKRNVEMWIYSFADMYMILSVFFIAVAVIYAARAKVQTTSNIPSASRAPAAVESTLSLEFDSGSAELNEESIENLRLLLPVLKSAKGTIEVEGYADSESLQNNHLYSSNLDLSNQRAVRVAEWIMRNGIATSKLRTYSYGNGRVYKVDGKTVKTNRRVLVKILSQRGDP